MPKTPYNQNPVQAVKSDTTSDGAYWIIDTPNNIGKAKLQSYAELMNDIKKMKQEEEELLKGKKPKVAPPKPAPVPPTQLPYHLNRDKTIGDVFPNLKQAGLVPTQWGIELEIEVDGDEEIYSHGYSYECNHDFEAPMYWTIKNEDSIRNGFELVSRPGTIMPNVNYNDFHTTKLPSLMPFVTLSQFLKNAQDDLTTSIRTSTHFHINVREHTLEQFYSALFHAYLMEPLLLNTTAEHRRGNLHCVPLKQASGAFELLFQCFDKRGGVPNTHINACKYGAVNYGSVQNFGSLEFRYAECFLDPSLEDLYPTLRMLWQIVNNTKYKSVLDAMKFVLEGDLTSLYLHFGFTSDVKDYIERYTYAPDICSTLNDNLELLWILAKHEAKPSHKTPVKPHPWAENPYAMPIGANGEATTEYNIPSDLYEIEDNEAEY